MEQIIELLSNNYEWVFSGIGVFILGLLFYKRNLTQKQKSGDGSVNIQSGNSINVSSSNIGVDNDRD